MAKYELGITPSELMTALPGFLNDAWSYYSDDKKITVDEGILIASCLLAVLGDKADPPEVKQFFASQAQALRDLAPLVVAITSDDDEE